MSDTPHEHIMHIGSCPFCLQGLARVRRCEDECSGPHFFALCDECEAIWLEPDTKAPKQFPASEDPVCPICQGELFGEQSSWATEQDLAGTVWLEFLNPELDS